MVIETVYQVPEPIRVKTMKPGEVFYYNTRDEDGTLVEGYYITTSRACIDPCQRFCVNLKTGTFREFDFETVIEPVNAKLVVYNE